MSLNSLPNLQFAHRYRNNIRAVECGVFEGSAHFPSPRACALEASLLLATPAPKFHCTIIPVLPRSPNPFPASFALNKRGKSKPSVVRLPSVFVHGAPRHVSGVVHARGTGLGKDPSVRLMYSNRMPPSLGWQRRYIKWKDCKFPDIKWPA